MTNKIVIFGTLSALNEYSNAQRKNKYLGAKIKAENTERCAYYVQQAMKKGVVFHFPCRLKFTWYCPNKRKDPDNIASAKKFILDGMQEAGFIDNDNWNTMSDGFIDVFKLDKEKPRIEIEEVKCDEDIFNTTRKIDIKTNCDE